MNYPKTEDITERRAKELSRVYETFNKAFFEGKLPETYITLTYALKKAKLGSIYHPDKLEDEETHQKYDEIVLDENILSVGVEYFCLALIKPMAYQYQWRCAPKRPGKANMQTPFLRAKLDELGIDYKYIKGDSYTLEFEGLKDDGKFMNTLRTLDLEKLITLKPRNAAALVEHEKSTGSETYTCPNSCGFKAWTPKPAFRPLTVTLNY